MGYADEEILKEKRRLKNEAIKNQSDETIEKEIEESIFDGTIHIYGEGVRFSKRVIEELGICIWMPDEFSVLDKEIAEKIYPFGNRPSHVFASPNINFNIAFNQTNNKVANDEMKEFLKVSRKLIENMGPKARIIKTEVKEKEDINIGIMEFITNAIDTAVYNIIFNVGMDDRLLIGTINFPVKYKKRQVSLAREIIGSFERWKEE